ncbi:hypothetical protein GGR51DRAFT_575751 [Nemania sp. FL0031]|nr:hypothetical protein GGR51DRAFT_575751 [Nemania sp. FL0031]
MPHHIISRLSVLLIVQVFLAGILAVPMSNTIANSKSNLIVVDDFKESTSITSHHAMAIIETVTATVTAQPDVASVTIHPSIVTMTVTTFETTIVNTSMSESIVHNSGGTALAAPEISGGNQSETVTVTYTTKPNTNTQTSSSELAGPGFTGQTSMTADPKSSSWNANSTSSWSHDTRTVTKLTTITSMATHSLPTSSFNNDLCDEIFCNTEGNKVCIYWAGVTSWDVSLGPLPGERPTIVGTC